MPLPLLTNEPPTPLTPPYRNHFKDWVGVLRLWSLTAATVPVCVGSALAAYDDMFSWRIFILTLFCGWLLQLATNLLNTYGDYSSGVDQVANPPTAPQLVFQKIAPEPVFRAGVATLLAGALLGGAIVALTDWRLLFFAVPGVAGAAFYTTGLRYKYAGLGLPIVALLMGVLMVMASYFAQTATLNLPAFLISLPIACLVGAILHGNDLRDIVSDQHARIKTAASRLGLARAQVVFVALHLAPYFLLTGSVILAQLPRATLFAFLVLPLSLQAVRTCVNGFRTQGIQQIARLESISAGTHFIFGSVVTLT